MIISKSLKLYNILDDFIIFQGFKNQTASLKTHSSKKEKKKKDLK